MVNAMTGTAVGDAGRILRTTTGGMYGWTRPSGTTCTLVGVSFANANHGMAVGDSGIILDTTDGGGSWFAQQWRSTNSHGVSFLS